MWWLMLQRVSPSAAQRSVWDSLMDGANPRPPRTLLLTARAKSSIVLRITSSLPACLPLPRQTATVLNRTAMVATPIMSVSITKYILICLQIVAFIVLGRLSSCQLSYGRKSQSLTIRLLPIVRSGLSCAMPTTRS